MSLGQIFKKNLDFLDKIFSKKTIIFISNKVNKEPQCEESKVNIANDQKSLRRERVIVIIL